MNKIERSTNFLAAVATIIMGIIAVASLPFIKCLVSTCQTAQTNTSVSKNCINNNCNIDGSQIKYNIGDKITFGSWPVGIEGEVSEAIEWEILEKKDDGTAIVLSSKVIDVKPYNTKLENITWNDSSLRKWLHHEFYGKAFTAEEKDKIVETSLKNEDNNEEYTQKYINWWEKWAKKEAVDKKRYIGTKMNGKGGEDTTDKVWLLSLDDIRRYGRRFSTDKNRTAIPMEYLTKEIDFCTSDACKRNRVVGNAWWWLRSPGGEQKNAAYIHYSGFVHVLGLHVDNNGGVRPALKINLNNL